MMIGWPIDYEELTSRNIGGITEEEQEILRNSTIAIAGCGCMGGLAADLLARFGIGHIKIADPDVFDVSNINRQNMARRSTVGHNKAEVLGQWLEDLNPDMKIEVYNTAINDKNAKEFLAGADYAIDGIDFYNFQDALFFHQEAYRNKQFVSLATAIGFGANVFTFDPDGITFEDYLGYSGEDNFSIPPEKYCPFLPSYVNSEIIDKVVNDKSTIIPSIGLAQALGNALLVTEIVCFLINKKLPISIPNFISIDLIDLKIRTNIGV